MIRALIHLAGIMVLAAVLAVIATSISTEWQWERQSSHLASDGG
jgi:hypothetical protein